MTKATITRRTFGGLAAAAGLTPLLASMARAQDPLTVALVVHGNLGDKSFFDSAAAGLYRARDELGIELTVIEAGTDRSRWQPALADAVDQGFNVIVAGTWEMTGFMAELAPDYPDTKFIVFDDTPDFAATPIPNMMGIMYRTSTAAYLAGFAAARISTSGKLGTILGVEGATVVEFHLGYEQGAKAANPDVEVLKAVAGSFTDPAKGKELALAQFAQGVDIVFPIAGGTGIGALQAARDEGKLAVGVDSDQAAIFEPTDPAQAAVIFTSVEKRVGDSLFAALEQTIAGNAPYGTALILGLADGAVGISKNAQYEALVPEAIRAEVDAQEAAIIAGEIQIESLL